MLAQGFGKVVTAVAGGDEVIFVAFGRVEGGADGVGAGHGDGGWGQSAAGVGVVGGVGFEVRADEVAVELFPEAVDDGGIGLQAHSAPQAVDEDSGDAGALVGQAGFFFHNGCEGEGFVGGLQGEVWRAVLPGLGEGFAQALVGFAQDGEVVGAGVEEIGFGQQQSFHVCFGRAEFFEDGGFIQGGGGVGEAGVVAEVADDFAEAFAFHNGEFFGDGVFAAGHGENDGSGGVAFLEAIFSGAQQSVCGESLARATNLRGESGSLA